MKNGGYDAVEGAEVRRFSAAEKKRSICPRSRGYSCVIGGVVGLPAAFETH
jgi:hypothetical protein